MTIADCGKATPVLAMLINCCAPLLRARRSADDESVAVRGEVVEVEDAGRVVARHPDLDWEVDPISLEGDEGELATRPRHDDS